VSGKDAGQHNKEMMMTRRRLPQRRRGALVVEMALTLPVLLLVLWTSYEFARANMLRHAADAAAYEAARAAIVPGASIRDAREAANFVLASVGARKATIRFEPNRILPTTPAIEVDVILDVDKNLTFMPLLMRSKTLSGHCRLRREGF